MEELERLQLNIQLPAGALEGFTRLAEQLRLLAEALGGGGQMPASLQTARTVPLERGENTAFDLERFREMGQGPREPLPTATRWWTPTTGMWTRTTDPRDNWQDRGPFALYPVSMT